MRMPWSFWVVAVIVIAALNPQMAQVIAFFTIFAGGAIDLVLMPKRSSNPLATALAEATGINPTYMAMGMIGAIIFAIGLLFLIAGIRGKKREPLLLHAGILMMGLVVASVVAVNRMHFSFG